MKQHKTNLRKRHVIYGCISIFIFLIFVLPQHWQIPVEGASKDDWNAQTFWFEPWGSSVTHKGIDIFANKGRPVVAAHNGIVVFRGQLTKGGKVIVILGPEFKLSYYAHLESFSNANPRLVTAGERIGTVGQSGNATNKPAHVHFSIVTLLPYFWKVDSSTQGWKKMFYLDPNNYLINH